MGIGGGRGIFFLYHLDEKILKIPSPWEIENY